MSETAFSSWPISGSKPVLSFYYRYNLSEQRYFQQGYYNDQFFNISRIETPIFVNQTDLSTNSIGYINIDLTIGENTFSEINRILLKSGDFISFERNSIQGSSDYGKTEIWRITNGSGDYLFTEGYVLYKSYENGDIFVEVYSGILKYL